MLDNQTSQEQFVSGLEQKPEIQVKEVKKKKTSKILHVQAKMCCGCGCSNEDVTIRVDSDFTEYSEGDIIKSKDLNNYDYAYGHISAKAFERQSGPWVDNS